MGLIQFRQSPYKQGEELHTDMDVNVYRLERNNFTLPAICLFDSKKRMETSKAYPTEKMDKEIEVSGYPPGPIPAPKFKQITFSSGILKFAV